MRKTKKSSKEILRELEDELLRATMNGDDTFRLLDEIEQARVSVLEEQNEA